jgi:hypothetical protein
VPGPITHFAQFICGYLGLVFCAVSLGCGVWVLIDSIRTQSHFFLKWSKLLASFLDWFRQPIPEATWISKLVRDQPPSPQFRYCCDVFRLPTCSRKPE